MSYAWFARRRWYNIRFRLGRALFGARIRIRSQRETVGILRQIVQALLVQLIAASVLVAAILLVEDRFITAPKGFSPTTLTQLLSVTAQVVGFFPGLYFTAVSVVASTACLLGGT